MLVRVGASASSCPLESVWAHDVTALLPLSRLRFALLPVVWVQREGLVQPNRQGGRVVAPFAQVGFFGASALNLILIEIQFAL